MSIRRAYFLTSLLALSAVWGQVSKAETPPTHPVLAVIGMSNEVANEDWRDARVGLGLRIILAQLFFDQGVFEMVEEKPEVRARLQEISQRVWLLNEKGHDFSPEIAALAQEGPRFVTYGKVFYFGRPRSKASLGPVHLNRNSVVIKVEVTLEDLETGRKLTARGKGVSTTTASSAIFSYREDNVDLDKTNVGNATKEALDVAVRSIMKRYHKKYGR